MYLKITNEQENHHGLQYQDGVVMDILPFNDNPKHSCCAGGIYFSDIKNILLYCGYGVWVREVEIPEGTRWIPDPNGRKWRAEKLFFHPRKELWTVETFQWLIDNGADLHIDQECILRKVVTEGYVKIAEFLINKGADIHVLNNYPLREAINVGELEMVKLLVKKGADVNVNNGYCLNTALRNGNFKIAKYLVKNGADVTQDNNYAIYYCALQGHGYSDMVEFLIEHGADISALKHFSMLNRKMEKAVNKWKSMPYQDRVLIYLNNILDNNE